VCVFDECDGFGGYLEVRVDTHVPFGRLVHTGEGCMYTFKASRGYTWILTIPVDTHVNGARHSMSTCRCG
jgi:hypothetical protein